MRIAVITVSDRASRGVYEDRSGPAIEEVLRSQLPELSVERCVVPDEADKIREALLDASGAEWVLTTGGTGPSPRDVTPEVTRALCDREMPGIADFLRLKSLEETPTAVFSRGYAGMRGSQYLVNLPGSERAARFCAGLLAPLLLHGAAMARGEGH
ncbi:MAG TPA: MogA/MoaB family molybdenum cofactor biosynthesis protein [Rectinemataceae bacterium]|nr:MogA/MoaB family molybdenum cofactor biosynthesis protein [Rectinemataceae bacterium]